MTEISEEESTEMSNDLPISSNPIIAFLFGWVSCLGFEGIEAGCSMFLHDSVPHMTRYTIPSSTISTLDHLGLTHPTVAWSASDLHEKPVSGSYT